MVLSAISESYINLRFKQGRSFCFRCHIVKPFKVVSWLLLVFGFTVLLGVFFRSIFVLLCIRHSLSYLDAVHLTCDVHSEKKQSSSYSLWIILIHDYCIMVSYYLLKLYYGQDHFTCERLF